MAAAGVVDTAIVNPDGVRDTQRRRGTTIRINKEKAGSDPGFFYFLCQFAMLAPNRISRHALAVRGRINRRLNLHTRSRTLVSFDRGLTDLESLTSVSRYHDRRRPNLP